MDKGRPSTYNEELAEQICELTATTSSSLKKICEGLNLEVRTVLRWLADDSKKDFSQMYARAKEAQADLLVDEILEIADDKSQDTINSDMGPIENKEWVNRSKVRVDARKWVASKLKPRKYSEKLDLTSDGEKLNGGVAPEVLKALADKINS